MRYSLVLISLVVLTSGCLDGTIFSGVLNQFSLTPQKSIIYVEDISLSAEAVPQEVIEKNSGSIFLIIENNGNNTIEETKLTITDPCILGMDDLESNLGELQPGDVREIPFDFTAGEAPIAEDCYVRYLASYDSKSVASIDVAVISEEEFVRLSRGGGESDVQLYYEKSQSPVDIDISFSRELPIHAGDQFFVYVKLSDAGIGEVSTIDKDSLSIDYPSIVKVLECDDLQESSGKLKLVGDLRFSRGETKTLTCKLQADDVRILERGKFLAEVDYSYALRDSINVRVVPE